MKLIFLSSFSYVQTLIIVIVQGVQGIGVIYHNIEQGLVLIVLLQLLRLDGTSHHLHQLPKLRNLFAADFIVNGITLYEVIFQNAVCPFPKLHTTITFYTITYRCNHFKVEKLHLMRLSLSFHSPMLSGTRKFCDYHFVCQFFLQSIVNMLANGLIITSKQCSQLLTSNPYHSVIQLHIKLNRIVFVFIYDYLILFHYFTQFSLQIYSNLSGILLHSLQKK